MLCVPLTKIWGRGTRKEFPSNWSERIWVSVPSSGGTCWMSLFDKSSTVSTLSFRNPTTSISWIWLSFINNVSSFSHVWRAIGIARNLLKDRHISRRFDSLPISVGIWANWLFEKLRYWRCTPFTKIDPGRLSLILLLLKFNSNNLSMRGSKFDGNSVRWFWLK